MPYTELYQIATRALGVEKLRLDTVANNIANQYALKGPDNTLFQPAQVVSKAKPFSEYMHPLGIGSVALVKQDLPENKVYQPGHPAADKQGYVTYPGISTVNEMTTMLRATRAFEANIKIINAAHTMYLQALTIGE